MLQRAARPMAQPSGVVWPPTPTRKIAVFFSPHPDDETLSMGAGVRQAVALHQQVWLVLATDGGSSHARQRLCQMRRVCLTEAQISASRRAEFISASLALGVERNHLAFAGIPPSLTYAKASRLVGAWVKRFGDTATYSTMSPYDHQLEHVALSLALQVECLTQHLHECQFFQSALYQAGNTLHKMPTLATPPGHYLPGDAAVLRAAEAYNVWDPAKGSYALGWTFSVPEHSPT